MALNESKGNMYDFVTHTWNVIKGECYHDCSYCYMKRWGKLNPVRFDKKELKTDLGKDNFIFVGSSCDMLSDIILARWITDIINHCNKYDNRYLFQTKNPSNIRYYKFPKNSVFCTTIETNRWYPEFMCNAPAPTDRALFIPINSYITVEPIMDFDLGAFVDLLKFCKPAQINLGADSGNNNLPEPPKEKIIELITELQKFTKVKLKSNLKRLVKYVL